MIRRPSAAGGVIQLDLGVSGPASDRLDAAAQALSWIRAALHAAGVGTPGWPTVETISFDGPRTFAGA